jgi:endonuclease/exonuclease/phosphatase family metal-dependent hydrolase
MKKNICTLFLLLFAITFTNCKATETVLDEYVSTSDTLKIATYNIRIKTPADINARSWENRKAYVAQLINSNKFDVFGVQEIANSTQENDLSTLLPTYSFLSKGRDNTAGTSGERIGVFYNKVRFTEENSGFFFLSETPDVASKGWDAALNRICVWMRLYDTITKKSFYFFNVHFDHIGTTARTESAKLAIAKIKEIAGDNYVVCGGDLNASAYETAVHVEMKLYLDDSRDISETTPTGSDGTFNGWNMTLTTFTESNKIDYIYCRKVQVISYSVLNDKYVAETYPSDHFPVMIKCKLK